MTKRPVNTNSNPFTKKRDVHVLMEHNVYVNMRKKLFESAMTFPECMLEFARLIGDNDPLANQLIQRCHKNKLKRELEDLRSTDKKVSFSELDSDALYNMIEDNAARDDQDRNEDD